MMPAQWCSVTIFSMVDGLEKTLSDAVHNAENGYATIFGYYVKDPERFGIMEFDKNKNVISVEEKPKNPNVKLLHYRFIFLSGWCI